MRTERRRRGLWGAIVDDPYRKLAAIGLAVFLWFFIDSRITKTITRTLPLGVAGQREASGEVFDALTVLLPTDLVLGKNFLGPDGGRIEHVDVIISGPRFRIDALENERLRLFVRKFLGREWGRRGGDNVPNPSETIDFTAADIQKDLLTREVHFELVPSRVQLEVQRLDRIGVPLLADIVQVEADALGDRVLYETARFSPEEAVILGPAVGMSQLRNRDGKVFRVTLVPAPNDREASGQIEIIGGHQLGISFERAPIMLVQLRPQSEVFTLDVPVAVDDGALPPEARGHFVPDKASLLVRVRAAGELRRTLSVMHGEAREVLANWVKDNLRLCVYVPRPEPAGGVELEAFLVPVGKRLARCAPGDYELADGVVVKLSRKQ